MHPYAQQHIIFILFLLSTVISAQPSDCNCRSPENLEKTKEHLKLATRISAMKLVASLRDLLHQTSQERIYALESTRYDVIKDLQNTYGKLITHTDFYKHFDWLVGEIKLLLTQDGIPEHHKLEKELVEVVDKALSRSLPSTFLCLSMGECVAATVTYFECMASHSHKWTVHFGKEPDKMARRLSESIIRYKQTEKRLESLQSILLNAEKTILPNCVERYANLTQCRQCLADRTSYCRESCEEVTSDCFLGISGDWDENIAALEHLAKDFSDGFYALERGIHNSLRRLLETTSPDLAQDVVEACGPLEERSTPTRATFSGNVRPTVVAKKTERLVQQLQSYRGHWKRISTNFCAEPSSDNFCWNGTNIVRAAQPVASHPIMEEQLPEILKNVRPRPRDPRVEGSGAPEFWDSDDEDDFVGEASGSGAPPTGGGDLDQPTGQQSFMTETTATSLDFTTVPPTTTGLVTPLYVESEIIELDEKDLPPDVGVPLAMPVSLLTVTCLLYLL